MVEEYTGTLASEHIPASVLAMLDDAMMDKRFMMPLSFDEASGTLSIITSRFEWNFLDSQADSFPRLRIQQLLHRIHGALQ